MNPNLSPFLLAGACARGRILSLSFAIIGSLFGAALASAAPLPPDAPVRGWTILAKSEPAALAVIAAAPAYHINHLELSQEIVSDLRELKDEPKRAFVNRLTDQAHAAGITEVVLWDHALYPLDYYPDEFRTGPNRTLDLDNPAFWTWLKADYRKLLDLAPHADAVALTFIGTAAPIEGQSSKNLPTNPQKLAAVVNAIADVVIGERHLNLYTRIFPNDNYGDPATLDLIGRFARNDVRLMIKFTPLDYFLTVPNSTDIGTIPRPTLVELDMAGEFNGEGVVVNTWIEDILRRWRDLAQRPHVIGYTARTDRLGESQIVGHPGEMNLLALKRAAEDPQVTAEQVYDEFLAARYGAGALPEVKAAFKDAYEITTSVFYTLGTVLNDHSRLDYDLYTPPYGHLTAGRWLNPPIGYVGHGVDREFHFWRDVVDHLAPPFVKDPSYKPPEFVPTAQIAGWLRPGEQMNKEYLRYIVTEKNYGVAQAEDAVRHIDNAQTGLAPAAYDELHHYFARTLLTARLQRAAASAYFGFRVWCRGEAFQTRYVHDTVQHGLAEIREVARLIRDYPVKPPTAQYVWAEDAGRAERYFKLIVEDGWPKESAGIVNPNAGMRFPYVAP
jgi:hypothetical protein